MDNLEGLDEHQLAVATAPDGRILVQAGAGTGKTRSLISRIGFLISGKRARPEEIMAVTFTNKAAREIRERVVAAVGPAASGLSLGTFHSLAARILRRHYREGGLRDRSFGIVDEADALAIIRSASEIPGAYGVFEPPARPDNVSAEDWKPTVKAARKEFDLGLTSFANDAWRQICRWKSWGLTADEAESSGGKRPETEQKFALVYVAYQSELAQRNICDFGDLILRTVTLLENNPEIRQQESERLRYVFVDEAQDANPVQVRLAAILSEFHGNLMVIGDEDQNIFAFQGGYSGAMKDMVGAGSRSLALVRNRRCTEEVLQPANLLVGYNRRSAPKVLQSGVHGAPVTVSMHASETQEAAAVAERIRDLIDGGAEPGQIACLVRSSYAMRPIEEALMKARLPVEVVGGTNIVEREEIKDILAYLRLAAVPDCSASFTRISNRPVRSLGPAATEAICSIAAVRAVSFHEACLIAGAQEGLRLKPDVRRALTRLSQALEMLSIEHTARRSPFYLIQLALHETGYREWVASAKDDADKRLGNIDFLLSAAEEFGDGDLFDFLDSLHLSSDSDAASGTARVRLSTIHSAKGLEFDHVFCPAFDAATIPSPRSVEEGCKGRPGDKWSGPVGGGIEEERRLAHVAFTRARKTLHVSFPDMRLIGRRKFGGPSCFIAEGELEVSAVDFDQPIIPKKKVKARSGRVGFDRRRQPAAEAVQ